MLVGPRTFVPLSWICKKQGDVSHSSTEAEIIALDTMMRLEGLPALSLWSQLVDSFTGRSVSSERTSDSKLSAYRNYDIISLEFCDWVPPSLPPLNPEGPKLFFVEDNDAVIKMIIKGRSPPLKHVSRTHRTNLDWLFERLREDPAILGRYIHTKLQIADLLTKGSFAVDAWAFLCRLMRLGPPPATHKTHNTASSDKPQVPKTGGRAYDRVIQNMEDFEFFFSSGLLHSGFGYFVFLATYAGRRTEIR